MDDAALRQTILATLRKIAPEVEPDAIAPAKPLRDQVDLDSMDWLNFLIAVHQRFKVEIAESDYATLATLDQIAAYVVARNPQGS